MPSKAHPLDVQAQFLRVLFWCDEHMDPDALTFSDAYVVAPGYIGGILLGIDKAGLTVFDTSRSSKCCSSALQVR